MTFHFPTSTPLGLSHFLTTWGCAVEVQCRLQFATTLATIEAGYVGLPPPLPLIPKLSSGNSVWVTHPLLHFGYVLKQSFVQFSLGYVRLLVRVCAQGGDTETPCLWALCVTCPLCSLGELGQRVFRASTVWCHLGLKAWQPGCQAWTAMFPHFCSRMSGISIVD